MRFDVDRGAHRPSIDRLPGLDGLGLISGAVDRWRVAA
jgi:hypothetical protein